MNRKLLTAVLTGTIFTMALLPALSNAGMGRMAGQRLCDQARSAKETADSRFATDTV